MITSHAKWPRSRLEASLKSASAQKRMVEKYCHRARPITARRTCEIYLKRPQTLAIFRIGVGTAFPSALCLSWPVPVPHHRAKGSQCELAASESLFLQHHHAEQAGTCSGSHDLRWCSGSPAERVRFSGSDDVKRNNISWFSRFPCQIDDDEPLPGACFAENKCLITNTHTLSGKGFSPQL